MYMCIWDFLKSVKHDTPPGKCTKPTGCQRSPSVQSYTEPDPNVHDQSLQLFNDADNQHEHSTGSKDTVTSVVPNATFSHQTPFNLPSAPPDGSTTEPIHKIKEPIITPVINSPKRTAIPISPVSMTGTTRRRSTQKKVEPQWLSDYMHYS